MIDVLLIVTIDAISMAACLWVGRCVGRLLS